MFPLTLCTIHEYKAGNNVSEFNNNNSFICSTEVCYNCHDCDASMLILVF